jgi:hypothetical protein
MRAIIIPLAMAQWQSFIHVKAAIALTALWHEYAN